MAVAILIALPGLVEAQQVTSDAPVQELEAITVTGQRASNRASVVAKLASDQIIDVVSVDEARQLPDQTVAEAISRIPGVAVTFSGNQNGRDQAERPVIRGMDARYNNVVLDGMPIVSVDNSEGTGAGSRGASLDLLPTSMIQRLEVYKSWRPDFDPNAIGGTINIVSRSAFDKGGEPFFHVRAGLGHNSDHGKPEGDSAYAKQLNMTYSSTLGEDQSLGVVLSADYSRSDTYTLGHMTTDSVFYNYYDDAGKRVDTPFEGNGYAVPQQNKYFWLQNARERKGLTAKLEARPNMDVSAYLMLGRYEEENDRTRHEVFIDQRSGDKQPVLGQTSTSGTFAKGSAEIGLLEGAPVRTTNIGMIGSDWHIDDTQKLSLVLSSSYAELSEPQRMVKFINRMRYGNAGTNKLGTPYTTPDLGFGYDTSGFHHVFHVDRAAYEDATQWDGYYWRTNLREVDNRVNKLRLDYTNNFGPDALGWGFAAGVAYSTSRHGSNWDYEQYGPTVAGLSLDRAQRPSSETLPYSGGLPLLVIDGDAAWALYEANRGSMTRDGNSDATSIRDDYRIGEDTTGLYLMGSFNTEKAKIGLGGRYDATEISSRGFQQLPGNRFVPVSAESRYSNLLPAASLNYDFLPELRIRLSANQTIGRPDYEYYAPRTSIGEASDGSLSITQGNPGIKPRLSTNLDVALEWHRNDTMVSLALFNKDIADEIFIATTTGVDYLYSDGTLRTATIKRPENASAARMRGAELGVIVDSFGWIHGALDNIGLGLNYTYLDGRLDVKKTDGSTRVLDRMLGQPDSLWNATLFGKFGPLDLRVAYNRSGMSLRDINPDKAWEDVFWEARDQLDFSANYRFNAQWSSFLQIRNLNKSPVVSVTGLGRDLLKDSYTNGRTVWLGVSYAL